MHERQAVGALGPGPAPLPVDRRAASDLSVGEFYTRYAKERRPVIITGLEVHSAGVPWSLDFFRSRCKDKQVRPLKVANKATWGGLVETPPMKLSEFIDSFRTENRELYLHDWSLPRECPEVFGPPPFDEFIVPRYVVGDYFQRAGFDEYQHAWPSLFVGSNETESRMHIDSAATHFWLYLASGQKEWRFFSEADLPFLYKSPHHPHFFADPFKPDLEKFPLFSQAQVHVATLEAGEFIFVPASSPHAVVNPTHIHAVSGNFVDASNYYEHLLDMLESGEMAEFELMVNIPHGIRSDQEPVTFGEWKSHRWADEEFDIY